MRTLKRSTVVLLANIPIVNLLVMYYIIFTEPKTKEEQQIRTCYTFFTAVNVLFTFFGVIILLLNFIFQYLII